MTLVRSQQAAFSCVLWELILTGMMQRRGLCRTDIDARELHVLLTAYWEAYYEPFVHDFTWEEIHRHAKIMCKLFNWKDALEIKL